MDFLIGAFSLDCVFGVHSAIIFTDLVFFLPTCYINIPPYHVHTILTLGSPQSLRGLSLKSPAGVF